MTSNNYATKSDLRPIKSDIKSLKGNVAILRTDVKSLDQKVEHLDQKVGSLKNDVLNMKLEVLSELQTMREENATHQFSHVRTNEELEDHGTRLRRLQCSVS